MINTQLLLTGIRCIRARGICTNMYRYAWYGDGSVYVYALDEITNKVIGREQVR